MLGKMTTPATLAREPNGLLSPGWDLLTSALVHATYRSRIILEAPFELTALPTATVPLRLESPARLYCCWTSNRRL